MHLKIPSLVPLLRLVMPLQSSSNSSKQRRAETAVRMLAEKALLQDQDRPVQVVVAQDLTNRERVGGPGPVSGLEK